MKLQVNHWICRPRVGQLRWPWRVWIDTYRFAAWQPRVFAVKFHGGSIAEACLQVRIG